MINSILLNYKTGLGAYAVLKPNIRPFKYFKSKEYYRYYLSRFNSTYLYRAGWINNGVDPRGFYKFRYNKRHGILFTLKHYKLKGIWKQFKRRKRE